MQYFRLLKSTPNADAGDLFFRSDSDTYYRVDVNAALTDKDVNYDMADVETNPEWFEPVVLIPVKPFNAMKLREIDDELEEGDRVVGPVVLNRAPDFEAERGRLQAEAEESSDCDGCEEKEEPTRVHPLAAMLMAGLLVDKMKGNI